VTEWGSADTRIDRRIPGMGHRRAGWRDGDVRVDGDVDYGTAFLDWLDIV